MAVTVSASDAEWAVIKALRESDYADLIPLEFQLDVARLVVAAARPPIAEEMVERIEDARSRAKAYHYRSALAKAITLIRQQS